LGSEGISGNVSSPEIVLLLVDLDGSLKWEKKYTSTLNPNYHGVNGSAIVKADPGNYLIAGTTNLEEDIYVLKVDGQGNKLFERAFGGINYIVSEQGICFCGQDVATNIATTFDGGILITGWTTNFGSGASDIYILKLDGQGNGTFGNGNIALK
jgi:hypothetical protein